VASELEHWAHGGVLAILRQLAEAHGGTVTAERAEGGGTHMRL